MQKVLLNTHAFFGSLVDRAVPLYTHSFTQRFKYHFFCIMVIIYYIFLQVPTTSEGWLKVEKEFREIWNFPHCLGSLDGKHVVLQAPINTGSEFFNYKSTFSIVLFALVDAQYNFLYVEAGAQGRISDGGIFNSSCLYKKIERNGLNMPEAEPLENRHKIIPYFFVGDEAFALSNTLMKPFSGIHPKGSRQRIFNYRLSRARRVVENVFGIMSAIFRVLRKPLLLEPVKAELVVMATAHLHNFLRKSPTSRPLYTLSENSESEIGRGEGTSRTIDNEPRSSLLPIRNIPRRSPTNAQEIRDELAEFFQNEGRVAWQDEYA